MSVNLREVSSSQKKGDNKMQSNLCCSVGEKAAGLVTKGLNGRLQNRKGEQQK